MDDQHFHETQPNGLFDGLALVGLVIGILLLVAAVVVYLAYTRAQARAPEGHLSAYLTEERITLLGVCRL